VIAANAAEIVDMRRRGKQPAVWVLVSFVGRIDNDDNGFTVVAKPDLDYDWRGVIGLDVIAFARKGQSIAQQLRAIRNEQPKSLSLWDVDLKTGAEVHFDFPVKHDIAHRRAMSKTLAIELDTWPEWKRKEFVQMGF
jgi:hypothetical protein